MQSLATGTDATIADVFVAENGARVPGLFRRLKCGAPPADFCYYSVTAVVFPFPGTHTFTASTHAFLDNLPKAQVSGGPGSLFQARLTAVVLKTT
jgi:hypothetical protein